MIITQKKIILQMPDDKIKNFNWRDYINVLSFDHEEEREQVEATLDLMFVDRDSDGVIDSKYASQLAEKISSKYSKDYQLDLTIHNDIGGQYSEDFDTMNVSFSQIENAFYIDKSGSKAVSFSINRVVAHELFHAVNIGTYGYESETAAVEFANNYMKENFNEPERGPYKATGNFDPIEGIPFVAKVYSEGEGFYSKEDQYSRDATADDLAGINAAMRYDLENSDFINNARDYALRNVIDFLAYFKDFNADMSYVDWVHSDQFIDLLEDGVGKKEFEKILTEEVVDFQKFNRDVQILNEQMFDDPEIKEALDNLIKERVQEAKEKESGKSSGLDYDDRSSIDFDGADFDVGSLAEVEYNKEDELSISDISLSASLNESVKGLKSLS